MMKTPAAALAGLVFCASIACAQSQPPALAAIADPSERARVEALIEGARAEGALEWTGTFIEPEQAEAILRAFKDHYGLPDLRTEYTYAASGAIITSVEQLLAADRNNCDIVWMIAWSWYSDLVGRGELLEYVSPNYAAYTLSNEAGMSREGYWVSDAYTFHPMFNPAALASHGLSDFNPKSWGDFLDPRLKGLVSMGDVGRSTTYAPVAQGIERAMGPEWFTTLAEAVEPVLFTQTSAGRDWVASGEFPVTLMSSAKNAATLREQAIDVRLVYPREGVPLLPFAPVILQDSPHPDAARLFIDFVRSEAGAQAVTDSGTLLFFGRTGIRSPYPDLLPDWKDVTIIPMDWNVEGSEERLAAIRKVFADAGLGF